MNDETDQEPQKIAIEASALANLTFYAENYDTLVFKGLALQDGKEIWGEKPPTCRFCGKTKPTVTFSKDAHLVPAFIGNKTL